MTDKELLELAAKAAGEPYYEHAPEGGLYLSNGAGWNPLTDDGDALRLAVKLKIVIDYADVEQATWVYYGNLASIVQTHGNDPYAATRRAIVRAAAAIGETL